MLVRTTPRRYACAVASLVALACLLWPTLGRAQPSDAFSRALERGPIYAAGAALLGGFLVSLTPCVYPMITITVSVFGARTAKSRAQALALSSCFVLGIIAMFVPLGVVAGLTGSVFGTLLSNRWVNIVIAVVFAALAASMFGAFEMVLPERLMQRLGGVGGIGYGGAFMLGLVCGIVAAPCTGPVLTGILLWIGRTQSAWLGAAAMTAFSVGLGIPFWLVGVFAVSLPKSGKWMMGIKSFFGVTMTIAALYFLRFAFPVMAKVARPGTTYLLGAIAVGVVGLALGAVHLDWHDGGTGTKIRKALGIVLACAGGFAVVANLQAVPEAVAGPDAAASGGVGEHERLLTFLDSEQAATELAKAEKRPLLVDFTADWCIACGKLARITFADPRVRKKAGAFVGLKMDLSVNQELPDAEQEKLEARAEQVKKKYGVVGLPTVLLYDAQGKERLRLTDFVGPDEFLKLLDGIE
jgi:thioredoxin:protein disulfide reductase